ncbi:MAG: hypothetical protein J3K34DRAFT_127939 [Monoraphidium minutum]|nr:MAG: hypothetical protein J3K34DRAFT_127939 [Monoraphidium minutum]
MQAVATHWARLSVAAGARAADLAAFAALAQAAAASGSLPELSDVPRQVLLTGAAAGGLALLLLLPRGRRLLLDTADTLLATAAAVVLLVVLLAALLSVPLGLLYVAFLALEALLAALTEHYPTLLKLVPQLPALMHSG